jgi:hypothetical protein
MQDVKTNSFWLSSEWVKMRADMITILGEQCQCCGQETSNLILYHTNTSSNSLILICGNCHRDKRKEISAKWALANPSTVDKKIALRYCKIIINQGGTYKNMQDKALKMGISLSTLKKVLSSKNKSRSRKKKKAAIKQAGKPKPIVIRKSAIKDYTDEDRRRLMDHISSGGSSSDFKI